ncbi:MAG: hypothetical protein SAL07_01615 [Oscillatoria sp. PMC 1051.18]|nr:hypothetical protein [Oscillatoria sp. PMC 1050.18]MEC5028582.1 hypothetical protein [Oscillatoria sp. PMC 1051.18]
MVRKIGLLCLTFCLTIAIIAVYWTPVQASSALESRIFRLETENNQLRSRLNRLENQVSRLGGSDLAPTTRRINPPPRVPPEGIRGNLSSDPMFDQLATLVIELKERIQTLEAEVAQLKKN